MSFWPRYVPVAERRAKALLQMQKLRKEGRDIRPVEIEGRTIARSFWGKNWCDHLESFSDYANRLPRGRTYVRNGSVCHLQVQQGRIEAMVAGSSLYTVSIEIKKLKPGVWKKIKKKCVGRIGSMLELLQGRLSDQVMAVVTNRKDGLFPKPAEIELDCSCPDWAVMCKHVASVLYGIGNRLDTHPELLFLLRGVDAQELIAAEMDLSGAAATDTGDALADDQLSDIFGVDFDTESPADSPDRPAAGPKTRSRAGGPGPQKKKKKQPLRAKGPKTRGNTRATGRRKKTVTSSRNKLPKIRPTGKSVARLRKKLGMSAAQFAETLGVTTASVYRWESTRGRLRLQPRCFNALAALHEHAKKK